MKMEDKVKTTCEQGKKVVKNRGKEKNTVKQTTVFDFRADMGNYKKEYPDYSEVLKGRQITLREF